VARIGVQGQRTEKGVCRTYGALRSFASGSQRLRTGLTCFAPTALRKMEGAEFGAQRARRRGFRGQALLIKRQRE